MRLPLGFCRNHCTLMMVVEKLHLRAELVPSWRLMSEGLCSTSTPRTPAWKQKSKPESMKSFHPHLSNIPGKTMRMTAHGLWIDSFPLHHWHLCRIPCLKRLRWAQLTANLHPQNPQHSSQFTLHGPCSIAGLSSLHLWGYQEFMQTRVCYTQKVPPDFLNFLFHLNSPTHLHLMTLQGKWSTTMEAKRQIPGPYISNVAFHIRGIWDKLCEEREFINSEYWCENWCHQWVKRALQNLSKIFLNLFV